MAIFCLYLVYGDTHTESGLQELQVLLRRLFDSSGSYIIINNATHLSENVQVDSNVVSISGDNSDREFSGWDRGFHYLSKVIDPLPTDIIVIANDTFHRNYGNSYLQKFRRTRVEKAINRGGLVGYCDSYPEPINIFGLSIKSWLRTSIIIGSYQSFLKLLPLSLPYPSEEIFSTDPQEFFKTDVQLSPRYKSYLRGWLTNNYEGCGSFRESWHSQQQLTEESFENLKGKTRSILCEHYLSARALKLGIAIFDVNQSNAVKKIRDFRAFVKKNLIKAKTKTITK